MPQPQPPAEAVRSLLFERAATLLNDLRERLQQAQDHISQKEHRATLGALAGLDTHIPTIRLLMQVMNEHFPL